MATDQLQNMVRALRAEAGHSLGVATGQNQLETLKYLIKRTQIELWTAFVWPDLKLRYNVPMIPGLYHYDFPPSMGFDQIRESWWAQASSAEWWQVGYGINEGMIRGDGANSASGDPVQYWDTDEGGQIRVWPTPSSAGFLRLVGNQALAPMVADSDVSTLDATLIVLFTASELLARSKAEDAAMKLQKAQRHLAKLLGNKISAKMKISTLGAFTGRPTPTPGIDYVPMKS